MASGSLDITQYELDAKFYEGDIVVVHKKTSPIGRGCAGQWRRAEHPFDSGNQGTVWLHTEEKTGERRAVKRLYIEMFMKELPAQAVGTNASSGGNEGRGHINVRRELMHLMAVKDYHHLFVQLLGWYQDERKDFVFIAMEYLEGGDLEQWVKRNGALQEGDAREITRQLLEGLVALHHKGICHRDLKPQNVLIATWSPIHVKIADFGISKSTDGTQLRTVIGTNGYMAPEVRFPNSNYTTAVDMWALGCLVRRILAGEPALNAPGDVHSIKESISSKGQPSAVEFVTRLLVIDPQSRMSAIEAQKHKWIFDLSVILEDEHVLRVFGGLDGICVETKRRLEVELAQRNHPRTPGDQVSTIESSYLQVSCGYRLILERLLQYPFSFEGMDTKSRGLILQAALLGGYLEAIVTPLLESSGEEGFITTMVHIGVFDGSLDETHILRILELLTEKGGGGIAERILVRARETKNEDLIQILMRSKLITLGQSGAAGEERNHRNRMFERYISTETFSIERLTEKFNGLFGQRGWLSHGTPNSDLLCIRTPREITEDEWEYGMGSPTGSIDW